jgi:hypothetical protein
MMHPDEATLKRAVERIVKRVCPDAKVGSGEHPDELDLPHVYLGDQDVGMYAAEIQGKSYVSTTSYGKSVTHDMVPGWIVYKTTYDPGRAYYPDGSGDPPSWDTQQLLETPSVGEAVKKMILTWVESQIEDTFTAIGEEEMEEGLAEI